MMDIEEGNEIVRSVVHFNMNNKIKQIKQIDELGYFKYCLGVEQTETNSYILFGFQCDDFNLIYDLSGKELFETMYKDHKYSLNELFIDIYYSVIFRIDISKFARIHEKLPKDLSNEEKEKLAYENELLRKELATYSTETAKLFSRFRINLYKSVIEKLLKEIKAKTKPKPVSLRLNKENNILFLVPIEDQLILIYGFCFPDKTEEALARNFCMELDDSKRHIKCSIEARFYPDPAKPPMELKDLETNPKRFSSGFVSFNISVNTMEKAVQKLGFLVNFKFYIQFHLQSVKTYLHIRMNKKGKEWERKLNSAKIISDEYTRTLEAIAFHSSLKKKDDEMRLFSNEFNKVNV